MTLESFLEPDGVELCPECKSLILVWLLPDTGERVFEAHYKEPSKYCNGKPENDYEIYS